MRLSLVFSVSYIQLMTRVALLSMVTIAFNIPHRQITNSNRGADKLDVIHRVLQ